MPRTPRTVRAAARAELTEAILERARAQLAEVGPAALSVRQIARDLELSSSALYRYFPSRDDLLTALLIAAFDDLGDTVDQTEREGSRGQDDLRGRFVGIAEGLRLWAVEHPHEWALTYGSPVPGYVAPADTVASATRVGIALLTVLRDAQLAGKRPAAPVHPAYPVEVEGIQPILAAVDPPLDLAWALRGLVVWATLFGTVSLEVFGHMANGILDYDAHFEQVVGQLVDDLGL
jgi:AcrR family transcriptional regulator